MKAQLKTFTISVPAEFYNKLEKMSEENERSKNFFVKKALENYFEDIYLYNEAIKVLEKDEPTYSLEEIMKEYGLSDKV